MDLDGAGDSHFYAIILVDSLSIGISMPSHTPLNPNNIENSRK